MNIISENQKVELDSKKIIICGKSCSGKTKLKHMLLEGGLMGGVSYTTRSMRKGEEDGIDYRFISMGKFVSMISDNLFFEYEEFNNHFYGTTTEDFFSRDVFILTPSSIEMMPYGIRQNSLIIFVDASIDERKKRAEFRGDKLDSIAERVHRDEIIFSGFSDYDMCFNSEQESIESFILKVLEERYV